MLGKKLWHTGPCLKSPSVVTVKVSAKRVHLRFRFLTFAHQRGFNSRHSTLEASETISLLLLFLADQIVSIIISSRS